MEHICANVTTALSSMGSLRSLSGASRHACWVSCLLLTHRRESLGIKNASCLWVTIDPRLPGAVRSLAVCPRHSFGCFMLAIHRALVGRDRRAQSVRVSQGRSWGIVLQSPGRLDPSWCKDRVGRVAAVCARSVPGALAQQPPCRHP